MSDIVNSEKNVHMRLSWKINCLNHFVLFHCFSWYLNNSVYNYKNLLKNSVASKISYTKTFFYSLFYLNSLTISYRWIALPPCWWSKEKKICSHRVRSFWENPKTDF